jgi:molybdopterin-guanine dinucleotide biosynthesis protein
MNPEEFVRSVSLPFAMVVASKRNSGKTQLVSQLIDQFIRQGKVWLPVVYSATAHLNDDY